jgi:protein-L-isoaspartate(D-aspartate) O-methyltransferase
MTDFADLRKQMVERQLRGRGIGDALVLDAMAEVPREAFLSPNLREFAYEDTPLPIAEGQTISQPYIVAMMIEALALTGGERVLEIGAGSGYAAAVLGRIAGEVYTIERHGTLAARAAQHLEELGYDNVRVIHADGSGGWPEGAPYHAIVVAAGGPAVPPTLREQLAVGGRLVMPIGPTPRLQELVRVTRLDVDDYRQEDLADVRFVPLIGREAWPAEPPAAEHERDSLSGLIAAGAEPFSDIKSADLAPLLERVGDARVVLLGEATHGTSEFYRMRDRITRELILRKGFTTVAVEADWPDAARVDHYVRHREYPPSEWQAFARFPTWLWRNREFAEHVDWLREFNAEQTDPGRRVGFYGLDLYSLHVSIRAVLAYLDEVDPETAALARERYACLTPWQADPAIYGRAALTGRYEDCANQVATMLSELIGRHKDYALHDGERFVDAVQNARLVTNAERYYRVMYYGSRDSWNLRDQHMFDTLDSLLAYLGPEARAVIWAHNSHIGDAKATEMAARGEHNLGQLCREAFGEGGRRLDVGRPHGGQGVAALPRSELRAALPWNWPVRLSAAAARGRQRGAAPAADGAAAGTCRRSHLPARERAGQPLLPRRSAAAVRRVYLVRPNGGGAALRDGRARRPAGHLSLWTLGATWGARRSCGCRPSMTLVQRPRGPRR